MIDGFERHGLGGRHAFYSGRLPEHLRMGPARFESLWAPHPEDDHLITIYGRAVETPRWQKAYGRDYFYAGGSTPCSRSRRSRSRG